MIHRRIAAVAIAALAFAGSVSGTAFASGGGPGSGGTGGGGGSSTTVPSVLCGTYAPFAAGVIGYYGTGGVSVSGVWTNCGNVQEVLNAFFTDTNPDPACTIQIPAEGSKLLTPGSTQAISHGQSSSGLSPACTTMQLTHTFVVDVTANGVPVSSSTWTVRV